MKNIKDKIIRQAEILGMAANKTSFFTVKYFADLFNVDELTIKRDLKELRETGISIHSIRNKGIVIFNQVDENIIKSLIIQYMGVALSKNSYDQAVNSLIKLHGVNAVYIIACLRKGIEEKRKIIVGYNKPEADRSEKRTIEPCCLFQNEKNWRLLAKHNGMMKQFLLDRITSVELTYENYKPLKKSEIDKLFNTSFMNWIGDDEYAVKLKLFPPWNEWLKSKQLMPCQSITDNRDGAFILETVVNSLDEIASWIVSRGKGIVVLEPPELKTLVVKRARETLSNYDL
ncbi:MAG: transcriptional regulator [Ignavibacteria bacterium]|nr:transcriptional regulator [Ignavibacteria bacterium]